MKAKSILCSVMLLLTMNMAGQDNLAAGWITGGGYEQPEVVMPMHIGSLAEAISQRPALPTVADLMSEEAKAAYAKKALAYEQAAQRFHAEQQIALQRLQSDIIRLGNDKRQQQARQQQAMQQASAKGLMPSQEELMQAVMSSGLNLETATEEQMMNVVADMYAKKWNISQADARTFMAMAMTQPQKAEAFLKQKYPELYQKLSKDMPGADQFMDLDADENTYGQLGDALMALSEEARGVKEANMDMSKHVMNNQIANSIEDYSITLPGLPTNEMEQLYSQIIKGWATSAECAEANRLENALITRLEEWMRTVDTKNGAVPYPQWWVAERKKINAQIDAWNKRQAEAWLAAMAKYDTQLQGLAQRLVELDNQLETVRGGKPMNVAYCMAKMQVHTARTNMYDYLFNCSAALNFPHVSRLPEQGSYDPMGGY